MSSTILGFIVKLAGKAIWYEIKQHLFKPDPNPIDAVLGGQQRIMDLIEELDYKAQIREPMDHIYYWTKRMPEVIDDLNRTNSSPESVRAYDELLTAMRSESSGIRFQTYSIYVAIMGDKSPLGKDGMLAFWEEQAYKKLADAGNMKYFMQDYIDELDRDIAAVIALLHHGLVLSFYVASDDVDAENLQKECIARVDTIRNTLFQAYPPAIRYFKPGGYDDKGEFLTTNWFDLYKNDDSSGKYYLTIHDFFCRELGALGPKGSPAKIRSFTFVGEKSFLGPVQLHAYWLSPKDNNSRVKFYDDSPDGLKKVYCYTNSLRSGKTYNILFKLIPLVAKSPFWGTTPDRPVRLVPFMEDSLKPTRADENNTFGNTWRFEVTNSPQ
ncbi:hypothetical protein EWM64_g4548 [Hericium alpestre]|uniref:Uncharacterized protein n=1 Tax=Hericium alpestre TaxID=135208 RepID=A0A4Y9ZX62_9AGAM|nr:hypothetical protein EWM64_g4548 [Hericium alpestre]